ncbi:unnamed protein product [Closterium sp. NIES-53]
MACTRALQQQGQQQHSRQWGPAGPKCGAPSSGSAGNGRDVGPCGYRALIGPGAGTTCWSSDHSASHCYRRLDDLRRERFGPHAITPHWPSRLRQRTAAPDESHPPGLGPFPAARVETCVSSLGACVVSSPAAFERLCVGAAATTILAPAFVAALGATSQTAELSFTLDSGASNCFFHDCTDLTPLRTLVTVALADPSVGPVVAHSTTTLPCPAAPSGFLIGYYTPRFSRNLVGVSHLHDLGVVTTFPLDEPVASCIVGATGAPLATFHKERSSSLYSLHSGSRHTGSGRVRSDQVATVSCDCRSLTHPSVLWHHCLGHPSFPRLSRMAHHRLVSGLPQLLAPLPRSPAPSCTPCFEGRQRAAPHSSSFPPTMSPFQTLHLDVWGPSPVLGPRQERYFLIVEDEYSRYTTVFPLRRKVDVPTVLEPWLLARGGAQALCGLRLQSDRGGSLGVAADFRVWGSLAHVRAPGTNKSLCTRACIFLGFPLDTTGWVFYDPLTYEFFSSQDVTFDESVCYYRTHPVAPVAPPPSRPALSGVLHATPQSSPLQRPVPVESGGAGGAVAEGEGAGAAGVGGVGSGGAGGVGVEVTLVEDTAASTRRPRPASPPGFPSVPQFPTHSSLRPVAAEPGGVPAGGTGGPGGVGGGGAGSGEGTTAAAAVAAAAAAASAGAPASAGTDSVAAAGESRGGATAAAGESRRGVPTAAAGVVAAAAGESRRGVTATPGEGRAGVPAAAAGAVTDTSGESRGVMTVAEEGSAGVPVAAAGATAAALGEGRGGATRATAPARLVRGPLLSPPVPPVQSLSSSQWTRRSPLSCAVSPEPRWSCYRADGLFHLVLRSRVPPPLVLPQPPDSSLTVLHDPLSDYLPLVTTVAGFASSHRLDYASHLVSGPACSPPSGGAPVFPLEVLEDKKFELGFLATAVPHLCTMLLAPEGDPDVLDISIPRNHAEAVSGPWASYRIAAEEAEMASYRSTGTYVDADPPSGMNVVSGRWLYKVKRPPGSPPVIKGAQCALDFFPSSADLSLFVRRGSTLFFVLVYILMRFRFPFSKVQLTPLAVDHGLTAPPLDESFKSSGPYPELVGCLMYLMTCIRPDLAYPLIVLARFVAPRRHRLSHWYAAKRVAKYVASTSGMGLVLGGKKPITLTGYSDSSWADDAETRRSTQGSSCEAEVYVAAMAAQELRWLSFLLTDLGERPRSPLVLFADNKSAILLCEEPRLVGKAKHIQLRYFLLHELRHRGQALVRCVVSEANTADIFTKALPPYDHQCFCTQLGLVRARPHLLT